MGIRLKRKKPRNILFSAIYRINKILPIGNRAKFKLYLDLEWIFNRLSLESSFKVYTDEQHPIRKYSKDFILRRITADQKVLDLGCKQGEISSFISKKANQVVGIDFDKKAIEYARRMYGGDNLNFEVGEASAWLETQNESFDVLILSHILEHLDQPKEFLKKFSRHFKYIYIELPDFDKSYLNQYRLDMGRNLIYTDDDHISEFDRYELRDLIKQCDLDIIDEQHIFGVQRIWCEVK